MVLITGASSGIGEASCVAFAKAKYDLILVARRTEKLKTLSQRLENEYGVKAPYFSVDVTDRKAVEAFAENNGNLLEKAQILLNNAGLAKGLSTFQEGNLEDWEVTLDTNIKGLLYFTRLLIPYFQKKRTGHIINLGSVAGRWVYPRGHVYCASKAAVASLTEALRLDLNGSGIRVTNVAPGMVQTEFSYVRLGDKNKADAIYAGMTPLTAADIADVVFWCASRPAHVNIQEVVVYPTDQASTTVVSRAT